jgi:hypothetical protein
MENEMDDLRSVWKSAKKNSPSTKLSTSQIIDEARTRKKSAVVAHYGNIAVMSAVVVMLTVTWYNFFPFRDLLSRVGVALMIGGMIIRIAIEIFSITKSAKVNVTDTTSKATADTYAFYLFRKRIHGPVTITIVALYIIGFYMLSPEFSKYISTTTLLIADVGFFLGAFVIAFIVRRGLKKEMSDLQAIVKLQEELSGNS